MAPVVFVFVFVFSYYELTNLRTYELTNLRTYELRTTDYELVRWRSSSLLSMNAACRWAAAATRALSDCDSGFIVLTVIVTVSLVTIRRHVPARNPLTVRKCA